ncbi:hypothetical protein K504DRAFT_447478 [Pleomassaria siparia CBS 279.74]|uniref:Pentatricopeptide repeat protein n=1 Tax=Pleomassaria siparia CBS 279.74 TaxID=1314801 RepID=A0A6G1K0Z0_9PLEO|nr:hypothetical protein K504DRAFT_447478 [Pleomassaria siparia CBS 279.74]
MYLPSYNGALSVYVLPSPHIAKNAPVAMLALWSRAARNPGTCKCISCISSNRAVITRRARVVGIKGPLVCGAPTSTFVYTAIFAVGLAIDAKAKVGRNEQWEEAFALLREELDKPNARGAGMVGELDKSLRRQKWSLDEGAEYVYVEGESISMTKNVADIDELFPDGLDWDAVYRVAGTELTDDRTFQTRQAESAVDVQHISEKMWKLLRFDSRFPDAEILEWPTNTGERLIQYHLPPQSLWSPNYLRQPALAKRQTWKKLALQKLSIGLLIHEIIGIAFPTTTESSDNTLRSLLPAIHDVAILSPTETRLRQAEIRDRIKKIQDQPTDGSFEDIARAKLLTEYHNIPQYFQDNDGDYYHICQQMNRAIKHILFGKENDPIGSHEIPLTLARVCHNLLVSSSAPDVQTFNILILGIKRCGPPDLVDLVINAFHACKIRPNEITCVAILDHYLQSNRPQAFSQFIAQMRGMYRGGLMLARPHITVNEKGAKRLIRVSEDKVIQKVHPTPLVFHVLTLGALKFAGCARALDVYYEMKEDGWGLDVTGLGYFLDDCIREADWDNGVYIWNEILSIIPRVKRAQMESAYSKMLSLCSVTGNTAAFNQLLKEIVNHGLDRRAVVKTALATVKELQVKPAFTVPPMTADNVLLTIGEYMDVQPGTEPQQFSMGRFEQNYIPRQGTPSGETSQSPEDLDAAWSYWSQQELFTPSQQHSAPQQESGETQRKDSNGSR